MNHNLTGGVWIAVLCASWMVMLGLMGWYTDPVLLNLFWAVVLIQIGVMYWALRKTAAATGYGKQVLNGLIMSIVAGVLLFGFSYLFTTVLFPNYFSELRAAHAEILRAAGKSEAEIALEVEQAAASQTPFTQALGGCLGTIVTGLIVSFVLALFLRKKG